MKFTIEDSLCDSSGIYSITNSIDPRFYIGSAKNYWRRYVDHRAALRRNDHANKYLQAFSNKYGIDKFSFNLLYLCKNTCLRFNEKLWIENLKPQFNLKKLITRPYFEDEKIYDFNKIRMVAQPIYLNMGIGLDDREIIKKYKHLPDLTITEELHYYSGIPPSCPYTKYKVEKIPKKFRLSKDPNERSRQIDQIIKAIKLEDKQE